MHVHTYGDVTAHARHSTPHFSTVQYNYGFCALYSLGYDSIQNRTKCKAIKEVNQTVKSVFEQSLLMH